MDLNQPFSKV